MDGAADVMAFQLAQEWAGMTRAGAAVLAGTAGLLVLAVALGSVIATSCRAVRPRRFWCPSARRDVEALIEEGGPPGFRRTLGVLACTAFEPASAVTCRRHCRDATRRQPSAFPGPGAS